MIVGPDLQIHTESEHGQSGIEQSDALIWIRANLRLRHTIIFWRRVDE